MRIEAAGDRAFLIRVGDEISPGVQAWVQAVTAALDHSSPDWLVDVVPSYAAVLVVFDPLRAGTAELCAALEEAAARAVGIEVTTREVTVPAWYDPEVAPDLEAVARERGLEVDEVIRLHAGRSYLVYMLGFRPGFPYMAEVDPRIESPRLSSPRLSVPAGSVAIAGRQTGIYPVNSPGGWRIVARTPWRIFAPERREPFLLHPGDRVRFEPVGRERFRELAAGGEASA